ncbi:MAG: methyltransferase domain-containing protein, partial [Candidatus Firestonebacteria bacterium]|nr:methyltransferase domain-containing protein [Candidatus Firestonebacteria bacterium]
MAKAIAILVAMAFIFPGISWAFEGGTYPIPTGAVLFNHQSIEIPRELGQVQSAYQGSGRLVIHIQDLHCNAEVQGEIARLLEKLTREQGLKLVAVEGASLPINVMQLREAPERARRVAGQYFIKQGKLSGAEYYAATGKVAVRLAGVEDAGAYAESRRVVAEFLNDESQGMVYDLRDALNELKPKVYTPALQELDQAKQASRDGDMPLLKYAVKLYQLGRKHGADTGRYLNLRRYVGQGDKGFGEVDSTALTLELEQLDAEIRTGLYTSRAQRELDALERRLDILERMLNISVTPAELKEYRQNTAAFAGAHFAEYISREDGGDIEAETRGLDEYVAKVKRFYELADARSGIFVENTVNRMRDAGTDMAVLVTGGFHTEGVLAGLRARNITYISVQPRLTHEDVVNPYYSLLRNRKTPLEKLLAENQNILSLPVNTPQDNLVLDRALTQAEMNAQEPWVKTFAQELDLALGAVNLQTGKITQADIRKAFASLKYLGVTLKSMQISDEGDKALVRLNLRKNQDLALTVSREENLESGTVLMKVGEAGSPESVIVPWHAELVRDFNKPPKNNYWNLVRNWFATAGAALQSPRAQIILASATVALAILTGSVVSILISKGLLGPPFFSAVPAMTLWAGKGRAHKNPDLNPGSRDYGLEVFTQAETKDVSFIDAERAIHSAVRAGGKSLQVTLLAENGNSVQVAIPSPAVLKNDQIKTAIYRRYVAMIYAQALALGNGPTGRLYVEASENGAVNSSETQAIATEIQSYFEHVGMPLLSKANTGNPIKVLVKPADLEITPKKMPVLAEESPEQNRLTLGVDVGGQGFKVCVLYHGKDVTDELFPSAGSEEDVLRQADQSLRYRYAYPYEHLDAGGSGEMFRERLVNYVDVVKVEVEKKYGTLDGVFINLPGAPDYARDRMASLGNLSRGFKYGEHDFSEANKFIPALRTLFGQKTTLSFGTDMTGWALSLAHEAGFKNAVAMIEGSGIGVRLIRNGHDVDGANEGGHHRWNIGEQAASTSPDSPQGSFEDLGGSIRGILRLAEERGLIETLHRLGIVHVEVKHIGWAAAGIDPVTGNRKLQNKSLQDRAFAVWEEIEKREAQHVILLHRLTGETRFVFGGGTMSGQTGEIRRQKLQAWVDQFAQELELPQLQIKLAADANGAHGAALKAAEVAAQAEASKREKTERLSGTLSEKGTRQIIQVDGQRVTFVADNQVYNFAYHRDVLSVPFGRQVYISLDELDEAGRRQTHQKIPDCFIYYQDGDRQEEPPALKGIWLGKKIRGNGLMQFMLNLFFYRFSNIRRVYPHVSNLLMLNMLIHRYGFSPEQDGVKPNVWIKLPPSSSKGQGEKIKVCFEKVDDEDAFIGTEGFDPAVYKIVEMKERDNSYVELYFGMPLVLKEGKEGQGKFNIEMSKITFNIKAPLEDNQAFGLNNLNELASVGLGLETAGYWFSQLAQQLTPRLPDQPSLEIRLLVSGLLVLGAISVAGVVIVRWMSRFFNLGAKTPSLENSTVSGTLNWLKVALGRRAGPNSPSAPQKSQDSFYNKIVNPGASISAGYNQPALRKIFEQLPFSTDRPLRVLDLGSGLGYNIKTILNQYPAAHIVASDYNSEILEISKTLNSKIEIQSRKEDLKRQGFRDELIEGPNSLTESRPENSEIWENQVEFIQADAQALAWGTGTFDLVICTEMLEHVGDPEQAMREIFRVLKPGGYAVISTPNYSWNFAGLMKRFFDWKAGIRYWDPWGAHHQGDEFGRENFMTADRLENGLKAAGFKLFQTLGLNYWLSWLTPVMVYIFIRLWPRSAYGLQERFPGFLINWIFPPLKKSAMNYFVTANKAGDGEVAGGVGKGLSSPRTGKTGEPNQTLVGLDKRPAGSLGIKATTVDFPDAGTMADENKLREILRNTILQNETLSAQFEVLTAEKLPVMIKIPKSREATAEVFRQWGFTNMPDNEFKEWVERVHAGKKTGIDFFEKYLKNSKGVWGLKTLNNVALRVKAQDGRVQSRQVDVLYYQEKADRVLGNALQEMHQKGDREGVRTILNQVLRRTQEELWAWGIYDTTFSAPVNWGIKFSKNGPDVRLFDLGELTDDKEKAVENLRMKAARGWSGKDDWEIFGTHTVSIVNLTDKETADWFLQRIREEFTLEKFNKYWRSKLDAQTESETANAGGQMPWLKYLLVEKWQWMQKETYAQWTWALELPAMTMGGLWAANVAVWTSRIKRFLGIRESFSAVNKKRERLLARFSMSLKETIKEGLDDPKIGLWESWVVQEQKTEHLSEDDLDWLVDRVNRQLLIPLGHVLYRDIATPNMRFLILYRIEWDNVVETDQGPVRVLYLSQITRLPDARLAMAAGYSPFVSEDVYIVPEKIRTIGLAHIEAVLNKKMLLNPASGKAMLPL